MKLNHKTALITGASSGVGKEIALLFAQEGADLCLAARRGKALSEVAGQCRDFGVNALDIVTDITDQIQVEAMARKTIGALGKIDILVNNAGYSKYGPFMETSMEEWDRMWSVNVRGPVLVTQAVVPSMIGAKSGHIVNISSAWGIHACGNAAAYCATKFAVTGLSEALSKELYRDGIKVSAICPGGVLTSFAGKPPHELNQELLEPEEVAQAVLAIVTAPGKSLITQVTIRPKSIPFATQELQWPL